VNQPETKYAETIDGVHIAYQVRGEGPVDLVFILGFASNFEVEIEEPRAARFADRLSLFSRLILFDKRGSGLSDQHQTPDLEMRADDLRAVLDAVGSERAVLYGESEGGTLAAFFAATHPDRVSALVLYGSQARYAWAPDYSMGMTQEEFLADQRSIASAWGTIELAREWAEREAPSLAHDEAYLRWAAKTFRYGASPAAALAFNEIRYGTDIRSILGSVQAPTLVMWRAAGDWGAGDQQASRFLADRIPGAQYVELPGSEYWPRAGNMDEFLETVEGFVHSIRAEQATIDRVLATILFTDIVGSTNRVATIGDAEWKVLLERHHETVRAMIGRYRGTEIDTAGDGFLATFDGPARGVKCAQAIVEAVQQLGLEIRAGLHTGEVEMIDGKVGGLAVHIGARVGALAGPSEVFVSQTVKDLVVGSGLAFEDAGEHELKGVPDRWRLYRVVS
jgi:class 3 adenylate cyclase